MYFWCTKSGTSYTYSIDKLVLDFQLERGKGQDLLNAISEKIWLEYESWQTAKWASFRDQFTFKLEGGRSFWLGVGLNGCDSWTDRQKVRLEFNPNKVGGTRALRWVYNTIWGFSLDATTGGPRVRRWDLAVDCQAPRADFELIKDGRLYEELRKSKDNRTQYVGQRNAPGRCKVYNKAIEAGLDSPLTRIELTLAGDDCGTDRAAELWPLVHRLPAVIQLDTAIAALNETDRFILRTLWADPSRVGELSRRKRAKLEPYLEKGGPVPFDRAAYQACLGELHRWQKAQPYTEGPSWSDGQFREVKDNDQ